MLHYETIEPHTLDLLKRIQARGEFAETRLVGGTALALQLGHRVSVDLDLFGSWPEGTNIASVFSSIGTAEKSSATLDGKMQFYYVDDIKVDCVTHDMFPWLMPAVCEDGVRLASVSDIAAMKINAITNRGTRKDFIDLYFLLNRYSFGDLMLLYHRKYSEANDALTLRSMVYFVDAEAQPMPRMLVPFDWEDCKKTISAAVRDFVMSVQS